MYVHTLSSSNTDLRHRSEHQTCVGTAQTHCATLPVNTQTGSSVSAVWQSDDAMNVDTADFREHLALKPHPIRHTIQHSTSYITQSSAVENIQPYAISGDKNNIQPHPIHHTIRYNIILYTLHNLQHLKIFSHMQLVEICRERVSECTTRHTRLLQRRIFADDWLHRHWKAYNLPQYHGSATKKKHQVQSGIWHDNRCELPLTQLNTVLQPNLIESFHSRERQTDK